MKQQLALSCAAALTRLLPSGAKSKSRPSQNTKNPKDYYKDPNVCVCVWVCICC